MYISRPIQQISGILYLENRVTLEEWKHQYEYDPLAISRIEEYMTKYKVAMEIQQFQETTSIPLSRIKKDFPDFLVPQMYYYIDNHPILGYIENSIAPVGKPIIHSFDNISSNDICVH